MLTLIGVGHVFNLTAVITRFIEHRRPRVVCIELDRMRYQALRGGDRKVEGPFTYRLLAKFQMRIAKEYGVEAGAEMLAAADASRKTGAKLALIDMPMAEDAPDLFESLNTKEKLKFLGGALLSPFISKKRVEKEMKKFDENPDGYMKVMEKEFPELSRSLITNRNRYMARNILSIHQREPDVIAVVGDGHIQGISELTAGLNPEIIRLKRLRSAARRVAEGKSIDTMLARKGGGTNTTAGFSVETGG